MDFFPLRPKPFLDLWQHHLRVVLGLVAKEHALQNRFDNVLAASGDADRDAEIALDLLVLSEEHIDHDAVNLVVFADVGDCANLGLWLPESVHAAFTLLMARRIPTEVVMDDGVEVILEIDALTQTVSADQDPALVIA